MFTRIKKWLRRLALLFVLLIAVLISAFAVLILYWESKVNSKIRALAADGQPTSLNQLYQGEVPNEQNQYWQLGEIASEAEAFENEIWDHQEDRDPKEMRRLELERTEKALVTHPTLLAAIDRLVACEKWARPKEEYTSFSAMIEVRNHNSLRGPIRVLNRVGRLAIEQKNKSLASHCLFQGLALADGPGKDEGIIDLLIRNACRNVIWELACCELAAEMLSHEDREKLLRMVQAADLEQKFHGCFAGERAIGLAALSDLNSRFGVFRLMWGRETWYYLDFIERIQNAKVTDFVNDMSAFTGNAMPFLSQFSVVPGVKAVGAYQARMIALQRALVTLIKLSDLPSETAEAPDLKMLGLEPEWTTDPYNNQPLRVKKLPGGWLVYSVYRDLRDDGGAIGDDDGKGMLDIGFGPPESADSNAK
jgi:hypothetical protein